MKSLYKICITETLARTISVLADNSCEALEKVEKMYDDEDIVLDADDFIQVNFDDATDW